MDKTKDSKLEKGFGELWLAFLEKMAGAKGLVAVVVTMVGMIIWFLLRNQGSYP